MSIRINYKQYPIPSSSQKVPYTFSVPVGIRRALTSLDLHEFIRQFKADMIFLSYRRFDFLTTKKINADSIIALYGNPNNYNNPLPSNYRYFCDRNNNISVTSSSFDNLRKRFCQDFHYVMDILVNKNIDIISKTKIDSFIDNDLIHELEKMFNLESRKFIYTYSLEYLIDNKKKIVDFVIEKSLDRDISLHSLRSIIKEQTREPIRLLKVFDGQAAIMRYSIRKD